MKRLSSIIVYPFKIVFQFVLGIVFFIMLFICLFDDDIEECYLN